MQLETQAAANRILLQSADQDGNRRIVKKKKKKKVVSKPKVKKATHVSSDPREHYRLNLREIPFVAGKVGSPSF